MFQGAVRIREVVGVAALEGVGIRMAGDVHLKRIDLSGITPEIARLFDSPLPPLLFLNDEAAAPLELTAYSQPPRYSAETRLELLATDEGVHQTYRFHCQPDSDRVTKMYVRFAQSRTESIDWNWGSESGESLAARRLTTEQCATMGRPTTGETWEVSLPQAQPTPFDVMAQRFTGWEEKFSANLSSLPDALFERCKSNSR